MKMDDTEETLPHTSRIPSQIDREEVVLTVLAHHDASYVGAYVRVEPRMELSRRHPEFERLEGSAQPLGDPYLSRKPLELRLEGRGVVLEFGEHPTPIDVDGERFEPGQRINVSMEALGRGVVLTLGDRVALLLHRRRALAKRGSHDAMGLIGVSEEMQRLRATLRKVAPTSLSVLICGESGTGKELVACAIHNLSTRAHRGLETLNMAALATSLAASELFGHSRGAFTGAARSHVGALERADGATLFLDEIGDTPADIQPLLLRALETGEILPVGASARRLVDVRILAATDVDLEAAILSGDFRVSLLHRISGFRVLVAPLRERREDIGLLILHFLRLELECMGALECLSNDPHRSWLSAPVIAQMTQYDWPGNIRQLRNVTRQLAILSCHEPTFGEGVDLEALLPEPQTEEVASAPMSAAAPYRAREDVEEEELVETLRAHRWRLAPAATALGVSRTSLYAMIERSPRVRKAADITADEIEQSLQEHKHDVEEVAFALRVSAHALKIRMKVLHIKR